MEKLIENFGCEKINEEHINHILSFTNDNDKKQNLLSLFKSGIITANRDLKILLDAVEKGEKFYIYTGRGPSHGSLHIGHVIPFLVCKYLQDIFECPIFIQLSTDEKFIRDDISINEVESNALSNTLDILSLGLDPMKTRIVSNFECIKELYPTVMTICKHTTNNQMRAIFGINESDNVGSYFFPAVESAPSFPCAVEKIFPNYQRCLVVLGLDQDPYFRLARDVSHNLKCHKPSLLHTSFIPGLRDINNKMSSSDPNSAIFLSDTLENISFKIKHHAFSGGGQTLKLHREFGANIDVDVSVKYLNVFGRITTFNPNNIDIDNLIYRYSKGECLTNEIKSVTIDIISRMLSYFQNNNIRNTDISIITKMLPL